MKEKPREKVPSFIDRIIAGYKLNYPVNDDNKDVLVFKNGILIKVLRNGINISIWDLMEARLPANYTWDDAKEAATTVDNVKNRDKANQEETINNVDKIGTKIK